MASLKDSRLRIFRRNLFDDGSGPTSCSVQRQSQYTDFDRLLAAAALALLAPGQKYDIAQPRVR